MRSRATPSCSEPRKSVGAGSLYARSQRRTPVPSTMSSSASARNGRHRKWISCKCDWLAKSRKKPRHPPPSAPAANVLDASRPPLLGIEAHGEVRLDLAAGLERTRAKPANENGRRRPIRSCRVPLFARHFDTIRRTGHSVTKGIRRKYAGAIFGMGYLECPLFCRTPLSEHHRRSAEHAPGSIELPVDFIPPSSRAD